jgi:hypothetical protein
MATARAALANLQRLYQAQQSFALVSLAYLVDERHFALVMIVDLVQGAAQAGTNLTDRQVIAGRGLFQPLHRVLQPPAEVVVLLAQLFNLSAKIGVTAAADGGKIALPLFERQNMFQVPVKRMGDEAEAWRCVSTTRVRREPAARSRCDP